MWSVIVNPHDGKACRHALCNLIYYFVCVQFWDSEVETTKGPPKIKIQPEKCVWYLYNEKQGVSFMLASYCSHETYHKTNAVTKHSEGYAKQDKIRHFLLFQYKKISLFGEKIDTPWYIDR